MEMMSKVVNLTNDLQPFSQMQGWFWKFKGLQGRNQTILRNEDIEFFSSTKPDLHPGPPPPFLTLVSEIYGIHATDLKGYSTNKILSLKSHILDSNGVWYS